MPQQDVLFRQEVPPPFVRNASATDKLQQHRYLDQYSICHNISRKINVCSSVH